MDRLIRIDAKERLYVVMEGFGASCLGFDVALRQARAVAAWAGLPPPKEAPGTAEAFAEYASKMAAGRLHAGATGARCHAELTPQLIGLEGRRVEVVETGGARRRFKVGRSTGWLPVHLELANSRSTGGPAVTGAPFASVRVVK